MCLKAPALNEAIFEHLTPCLQLVSQLGEHQFLVPPALYSLVTAHLECFSFLHDWSHGTLAFKASTLKVSSENIFERSPLIWFHQCCQFLSIYDDCYFSRRKRGLLCS